MVESQRHIGDKITIDKRYFISSLKETDELFAKAVRRHWSVENELHWVLDVSFREDDSRIRRENGAYIVDVQLASGALSGQDVQIEGDTIKFNMNIGGVERVSMLLVVAGNKISGDTYATKGNYKIKGIRKLPPQ